MPAWIVALILLWAAIVVLILVVSARAIRRHTRHSAAPVEPLLPELEQPHNSVLLYPPSARSAGLSLRQVAEAAPVRAPCPADAACTICLDDMAPHHKLREIRVCGHRFHAHCIRDWLIRSNTCPNCQRVALEEPGVELEIETLSSKDWRSMGDVQWIGHVQASVTDRTAAV